MKHKIMRLLALLLCISMILPMAVISVSAADEISLPDLISDNMLIQRDAPVKLWGFGGTVGETVAAVIEDAEGNAVNEGSGTIGEDGFTIELDPMQAGGPYTIYFRDADRKTVATVKNVLIGDLFLQGGQSNMQYRINSIPEFVEERVTPNPTDDKIRLFYNGAHISSETPAKDLKGEWVVADKYIPEYSAVGYQALEDIYNEIKIPVGGVCSPYGGSGISSFFEGSEIYNAKIAPLTSMNFKGVMWYQGETDAIASSGEAIGERYNKLIRSYREIWKDIPFIIVQLHPSGMKGENSIEDLSTAREGQLNAYLSNENVGMVVAMDLSLQKYKEYGEDPAHPWIKKPVGQRMANVALSMIYGKDVQANSPVYVSHTIEGNAIKVTVKDSYDGLKTSDGKRAWGFMIAGEDGVYHEAKAVLEGNTITLTSNKVPNPVSASYGIERHIWPYTSKTDEASLANTPAIPDFPVNVVNSANLPLAAFNTEVVIDNVAEIPSDEQQSTEENRTSVSVEGVKTSGDRTILYVSADGKDTNPGTINAPLASIEGARDIIRAMKTAGTLGEGGAVVYIREGNYIMHKGVIFTEEDSGTDEAPIVYRNYPDEKVNFFGGAYLNADDFKPVQDKQVLERIVDEKAREKVLAIDLHALGFENLEEPVWEGTYSYYQIGTYLTEKFGLVIPTAKSSELIIDGKGATIARYPNDGSMTIGEVVEPGNYQESDKPMVFSVYDDRVKNWTKAENAILSGTFKYSWASQATALDSVDANKNMLHSKYPVFYGATTGQQFIVMNLVEEIDVPGEYFVDTRDGILYLYPPEEMSEIIYTTLDEVMFTFNGTRYVTMEGIGMKYTRKYFVNYDKSASNNQLVNCEFTFNSSDAAVCISGNDNKVYDCYFHDCSVGVQTTSGDRATLTRSNNLIENCKFERCDRLNKTYSPAVYIYESVGVNVYNNEISDAEHDVVQMGGNYNDISYNEIYNACTNTDDMGAIYTGRNLTMRGNQFKNNYIHDIGGANRGTNGVHGIFFDDFWSAGNIVGNVFANITGGGVMFAGSYNVVDNNIFINTGTTKGTSMILTRSYNYGNADNDKPFFDGLAAVPYMSDVWVEAFPEIVNVVDEDGKLDMNNNIVVTNNVLYNSGEPRISAEIMRTITLENNVTYKKDPGFYDLKNKNYLLKEDSVVYTDIPGFEPIPFTRIGRYDERAISRTQKGMVFCIDSPYVYKAGERVKTDKNQALAENETIYVPLRTGTDAVGATLTYDEATDKITVSGSGKLLEFTDGASDKVNVNGTEYTLSKPLININGSNYISISDLVNIFDKILYQSGNIAAVTDFEGLFNYDADQNLFRWLEEQLSVY